MLIPRKPFNDLAITQFKLLGKKVLFKINLLYSDFRKVNCN